MKTNLLTYDHSRSGPTRVLIEVPGIPVRITILDEDEWASVRLVAPQRQTVQVGLGDPHDTGIKVRAVDFSIPGVRGITGVLRNSFSFVSSSGGSVIQCAGSLSMGLDRDPFLELSVPAVSQLDMRSHGPVEVVHDGAVMSLDDAIGARLIC